MEVIFKGDLLVTKIKITYLILSPLVICYFGPILIFDLDHFFGDLPYLWWCVINLLLAAWSIVDFSGEEAARGKLTKSKSSQT